MFRLAKLEAWCIIGCMSTTTLNLINGGTTTIDSDLEPMLSRYHWRKQSNGYAACNFKIGKQNNWLYLHRLINRTPKGLRTDHKDQNTLNNVRSNLRSTISGNNQNSKKHQRGNITSRFKGVWMCKGKWISQIGVNYKRIHLGTFESEAEAAKAYNTAAKIHHGEFACLNVV